MDKAWCWDGSGVGEMTVISRGLQKNAKKMQKNARLFAYVKKKQYLCSGFGNGPNRNHLMIKSYEERMCFQN